MRNYSSKTFFLLRGVVFFHLVLVSLGCSDDTSTDAAPSGDTVEDVADVAADEPTQDPATADNGPEVPTPDQEEPLPDLIEEFAPDLVEDVLGEPDLAGTCAELGGNCNPDLAQAAPWVCVDDDDEGICRIPCLPWSVPPTCPAGTFCAAEGDSAWCTPSECTHFFTNDCPDDGKCVPALSLGPSWRCTTMGDRGDGVGCTADSDCDATTLCLEGRCQVMECSAITDTQACDDELDCFGVVANEVTLDVGTCHQACTMWEEPSACSESLCCVAWARGEVSGMIEGRCEDIATGTAGPGDICDTSRDQEKTCECGTICLAEDETTARCAALCDPEWETSGSGACPEGEWCTELSYADGSKLVYGACQKYCVPFGDDSDCGPDQWCVPDLDHRGIGSCADSASPCAGVGEGCGDLMECCDHLICLLGDDGLRCEPLCDPAATGDELGQCPEPDAGAVVCRALQTRDVSGSLVDLAIGTCATGCSFVHGDPFNPDPVCAGEDDVCHPGEILDVDDIDICEPYPGWMDTPLDELDDCPPGTSGNRCRPSGICFDLSGVTEGLQCIELCTESGGTMGSDHHPDCTREDAVCTDVWDRGTFGVCI